MVARLSPMFDASPFAMSFVFTIGAISLNLLLGYTGQLSLGHIAFFGIGAYASALTTFGLLPLAAQVLDGVRLINTRYGAAEACSA